MIDNWQFRLLMVVAVFISSISQILLKKSSNKIYKSRVYEYLNPYVIIAYTILFTATLLNVISLKNVPINNLAIIEASGYIFVALLARIFLKEKVSKRTKIGFTVIILGIVVFLI